MNRQSMAPPTRGIIKHSTSRRNRDGPLPALKARGIAQHPSTRRLQERAGEWQARLATVDITKSQPRQPFRRAPCRRAR